MVQLRINIFLMCYREVVESWERVRDVKIKEPDAVKKFLLLLELKNMKNIGRGRKVVKNCRFIATLFHSFPRLSRCTNNTISVSLILDAFCGSQNPVLYYLLIFLFIVKHF